LAEFWDVLDENGNATGRLHERGKPMNKGDYHLEVSVWIENDKGETCNAMWASRDEINRMIDEGTFRTWEQYKYVDDLFEGF